MGLPKRKGVSRRQVLDINNREDSPSRSTWQTKYQQILNADIANHNGDSQPGSSEVITSTTSSSKRNALTGLVGNYNSDSDNEDGKPTADDLDSKVEDFLKEIQTMAPTNEVSQANTSISYTQPASSQQVYPSSVTSWQQCYDENSGFPYYWNTETNEVTWEMPPDLKAAIANFAMQQRQQNHHPVAVAKNEVEKEEVKKPARKRYPWEGDSDSEDEKIEMITSFGPQSDEEDVQELKKKPKITKNVKLSEKKKPAVGPQLLIGPVLPIDSTASTSDDTEAEPLRPQTYDVSSLMTHVPDNGPPGEEHVHISPSGETMNVTSSQSASEVHSPDATDCPDSSEKDIGMSEMDINSEDELTNKHNKVECSDNSEKEEAIPTDSSEARHESDGSDSDSETLLKKLKKKAQILEKMGGEVPEEIKTLLNSLEKLDSPTTSGTIENIKESVESSGNHEPSNVADDVIAQIEMETPPDYKLPVASIPSPETKNPSSFALIKDYGEDSENEETPSVVSQSKTLFPIGDFTVSKSGTEQTSKPLFPIDNSKKDVKPHPEIEVTGSVEVETKSHSQIDSSLPDSTTTHKAFKRKKRIEFDIVQPSTSKCDERIVSHVYDTDPSCNEHRGLGFTTSDSTSSNFADKKKFACGIQFIKAETINMPPVEDVKKEEPAEEETLPNSKGKEETKKTGDPQEEKEILDSASLIEDKVMFLSEGKEPVSSIQQIPIQLETLVSAWRAGALTRSYLSRWLKNTRLDLARHEKSAAPPGWTCSWDRKNKRYFYRNLITKHTQWEYPTEDISCAAEPDVVGGGDEMELCDTPPPPMSPPRESTQNNRMTTPPPPLISESQESGPSSPVPPPPPRITDYSDKHMKKKKKKVEEVSSTSESQNHVGQLESTTDLYTSSSSENVPEVPPLPPMPPPPPPKEPPPLPATPPPLPIEPDQPLPPGVDEPEYTMLRKLSPKPSFPPYKNPVQPEMMYYLPHVSSSQPYPIDYQAYTNHYPTIPPVASTEAVIHCPPAKKPRASLNSELNSFYSDIAMLDGSSTSEQCPPVSSSQVVSQTESVKTVPQPQPVQQPVQEVPPEPVTKKRKKTKLGPGLSLKKKGVSSLVAKWQQVQQEVRRDMDVDDDDEDVSSTHR